MGWWGRLAGAQVHPLWLDWGNGAERVEGWPLTQGLVGAQGSLWLVGSECPRGNSGAPSATCTSQRSKFESCFAFPSLYPGADLTYPCSASPVPRTSLPDPGTGLSSCNGELGEAEKVCGRGGTPWTGTQHLWVSVLPPGLLAFGGVTFPLMNLSLQFL